VPDRSTFLDFDTGNKEPSVPQTPTLTLVGGISTRPNPVSEAPSNSSMNVLVPVSRVSHESQPASSASTSNAIPLRFRPTPVIAIINHKAIKYKYQTKFCKNCLRGTIS